VGEIRELVYSNGTNALTDDQLDKFNKSRKRKQIDPAKTARPGNNRQHLTDEQRTKIRQLVDKYTSEGTGVPWTMLTNTLNSIGLTASQATHAASKMRTKRKDSKQNVWSEEEKATLAEKLSELGKTMEDATKDDFYVIAPYLKRDVRSIRYYIQGQVRQAKKRRTSTSTTRDEEIKTFCDAMHEFVKNQHPEDINVADVRDALGWGADKYPVSVLTGFWVKGSGLYDVGRKRESAIKIAEGKVICEMLVHKFPGAVRFVAHKMLVELKYLAKHVFADRTCYTGQNVDPKTGLQHRHTEQLRSSTRTLLGYQPGGPQGWLDANADKHN
jgi:hypothetical protein